MSCKAARAESVGAHGESPPVIVSKPQASSTELPPPQQAILFEQISERLRFPPIQPTRDAEEQQPNHRHVDHGGSLYQAPQRWPESLRS
jgi:hypothetical protein